MMSPPGFTADASLYTPARHYRGRSVNADGSLGVSLAQFPGRGVGCYRTCLAECSPADPYCEDNCHCICYGKPGHTCWLR